MKNENSPFRFRYFTMYSKLIKICYDDQELPHSAFVFNDISKEMDSSYSVVLEITNPSRDVDEISEAEFLAELEKRRQKR